jgi:hypothetical protein
MPDSDFWGGRSTFLPSVSNSGLSFESGEPIPTNVPCITMLLCIKLTTSAVHISQSSLLNCPFRNRTQARRLTAFVERTVNARVTPKIAAANFSGSRTSARYSDAMAAMSKGLIGKER